MNAIKYGADEDGRITKTKLVKLVYLADFIWFYENSRPMTGVKYRKMAQGPVAYEYFRALDEIEEEGVIMREPKGRAIMLSLTEKQAPTGKLTEDKIKMVKKIDKAWKGKPTVDVVNFTHEQLPWQIWTKTLANIIFICEHIENILKTQRADLISVSGDYRLAKLDFAIFGL